MTPRPTGGELSVRGVSKSFGGRTVLSDVDLEIPAGGSVAVVGPSGCGKTTLLRIVAGFECPDAGAVRLGGCELAAADRMVPAHKRQIGYVPQDGALFPHLSVGGNVGFGLPRRQRTPGRIADLLERVHLDPATARWRPDQLSGGQQQRVAVARALAQSPHAVLLDESFSALDAGLRAELRSSVADILRAGGVTTVLVTHDHEEALSFADQVAVMRGGTFVQVGTPREVYLQPVDEATAEFFGDMVRLVGEARHGVATTALGPVRLVDDEVAGRVALTVRTEQVLLGPIGSSAHRGVVRDCRFLGSSVQCQVEVAGAGTVAARCRPQDAPVAGDTVGLTVVGQAWVDRRTDDHSTDDRRTDDR